MRAPLRVKYFVKLYNCPEDRSLDRSLVNTKIEKACFGIYAPELGIEWEQAMRLSDVRISESSAPCSKIDILALSQVLRFGFLLRLL